MYKVALGTLPRLSYVLRKDSCIFKNLKDEMTRFEKKFFYMNLTINLFGNSIRFAKIYSFNYWVGL